MNILKIVCYWLTVLLLFHYFNRKPNCRLAATIVYLSLSLFCSQPRLFLWLLVAFVALSWLLLSELKFKTIVLLQLCISRNTDLQLNCFLWLHCNTLLLKGNWNYISTTINIRINHMVIAKQTDGHCQGRSVKTAHGNTTGWQCCCKGLGTIEKRQW